MQREAPPGVGPTWLCPSRTSCCGGASRWVRFRKGIFQERQASGGTPHRVCWGRGPDGAAEGGAPFGKRERENKASLPSPQILSPWSHFQEPGDSLPESPGSVSCSPGSRGPFTSHPTHSESENQRDSAISLPLHSPWGLRRGAV